ncbi:MAG: GNAT family protein [Patescibacteria group bacterium]
MSDATVFLRGKRVYLRPMELSDVERTTRWINDPVARRWLSNVWPLNQLQERAWIEAKYRDRPAHDLTFALVLTEGDVHIGNLGLHNIDWVHRSATTGMLIGEADARGKGYGPEAKELLLDYVFNTLGLELVEAGAFESNMASRRSLEKSGYTLEATLRRRYYRDGQWHNECVFSITAEEWRARPAQK